MNADSSSAALINIGVLIAVSALACFVFPGRNGIMIAIGIVAGFVLAMLTFGRTMPAGTTIPTALGAFAGLVLIAFAVPWMTSLGLRTAEAGPMHDGLLTISATIGALLWGIALRLLWNARKLIR